MFRSTIARIFVAITSLALLAAVASAPVQVVSGTVQTAPVNGVFVLDLGGNHRVRVLAATAKLLVNGRPGTMSAIVIGRRVRVIGRLVYPQLMATEVDVMVTANTAAPPAAPLEHRITLPYVVHAPLAVRTEAPAKQILRAPVITVAPQRHVLQAPVIMKAPTKHVFNAPVITKAPTERVLHAPVITKAPTERVLHAKSLPKSRQITPPHIERRPIARRASQSPEPFIRITPIPMALATQSPQPPQAMSYGGFPPPPTPSPQPLRMMKNPYGNMEPIAVATQSPQPLRMMKSPYGNVPMYALATPSPQPRISIIPYVNEHMHALATLCANDLSPAPASSGVAPTVLFTWPVSGQHIVPNLQSLSIEAAFSEAMNPSTIAQPTESTGGTFTVSGPGGPVAGTVTLGPLPTLEIEATPTPYALAQFIAPTNSFEANTTYTACITTAAQSSTNVPMQQNYVWTFTTGALPTPPPPPPVTTSTYHLANYAESSALAIDAAGNVWVAASEGTKGGVVIKLNSSGAVIGTYPETSPYNLAIDIQGNVWMTNASSGRAFSTGYVTEINQSGSTIGVYNVPGGNPISLTIDTLGNVWVTNNNNLTELGPSGQQLNTYPVENWPQGIAIDGQENLWIPRWGTITGKVDEISATGVAVNSYTMGSAGPCSAAIDPSGNVWVTDIGFHLRQYNVPGDNLNEISPSGKISTYNVGPSKSIAIDSSGNVWITSFNSTGNFSAPGTPTDYAIEVSPFGTVLHSYPVGGGPTAIAIDSEGNVWVASLDATVTEIKGAATGPQYFPYSGPEFPGSGGSGGIPGI